MPIPMARNGRGKSYTMYKVFVDTNILAYSIDNNDEIKRDLCRNCLRTLRKEGFGVISTQVLQEFYVVATKKLKVDPLLAKTILHSFENFEVVVINPVLIKDAIDCSIVSNLSFWDALIVVTAESARCEQLWTEDLNHNQIIRNVRIVNPCKTG